MNATAPVTPTSSANALPLHVLRAEVSVGASAHIAPLEAAVIHLGRRAIVLQTAGTLERGAHAWVAVTLPDGEQVRPLVQVVGDTTDGLACRIVHVFPNDTKALELFHAAKATASGY